ncbi:CLUMA_CG007202, isoform A [Clunio marinus]|uniref:CLUMA_CG007202, isoform A n=1 Tax=Clunio marinus TaxID=568069 RepID=A0A1J1I5M1_9DIPT|nr:CLUMA_CG007202, isoform A [Clunio marinus]
MSASPIARQAHTHAQMIPSMRRVLISDPSQMPDVYSSTPNGTIYGTTPGGTKIVYERTFLMNLRNSPLSQTPPKNIPCHLMKDDRSNFHNRNHQNQMNGTYHPPQQHHNKNNNNNQHQLHKEKDKSNGWSKVRGSSDAEEHQFDMDI